MSIGPLDQFSFPGTYVKTDMEAPTASAAGAQRFAAMIGVGLEESRVNAFEMVRGSSASAANIILGELAIGNGRKNVLDGVNVEFYTKYLPLVINDGKGTYATDPSHVIVTVNSENVQVQSIDAVKGKITLVTPPAEGDVITLNYYFKRRDTYVENEDISLQADGVNRVFKVGATRIVKGDNGSANATSTLIGTTATTEIGNKLVSVAAIQVLVNGVEAPIDSISGGNGTFTLKSAPAAESQVLVSYFKNDWQNTGDILPAAKVTNIVRAGYDPGRADFIEGRDFILAGDNTIKWGNSVAITTGDTSVGSTALSADQISVNMVDDRLYKVQLEKGANARTVILPYTPVTGEGKGTPLENANGVKTSEEDDILVYVGTSVSTATPVKVSSVKGKVVTLVKAVPAESKVFADFYVSNLLDDMWTVECKTPGATGHGEYTVKGSAYGSARQVSETDRLGNIVYADTGANGDSCNAKINPSRVFGDEDITVVIAAEGTFTVTSHVVGSPAAGPTGSDTTKNKGVLGQTYIDPITGFTFTLSIDTTKDSQVEFSVRRTFKINESVATEYGIPGLNLVVSSTEGVAVNDTAEVTTYNMTANEEPSVGDVYYVTFDQAKIDYTPKYFTSYDAFTSYYGTLAQNNPLSIGAFLYFRNGGSALVVKQIKKAAGASDASVSAYLEAIDTFNDPLSNGTRPCLICALSTDPQVTSYLKTSNAQQSSIRFRNERTSYVGFAKGTTPEAALAFAKGLSSELISLVYPDSAVMTIPDADGKDQDVIVGGEFVAAALTGADVSSAYDVATPLTNVQLVGFKRLGRALTQATAGLVAQAGVTVLEFRYGVLKVLMSLTTDMSSPLTRDPRIVEVKHEVQRGIRRTCDPFIGRKNINGLTNDVRRAVVAYFTQMKFLNLIGDFGSAISVSVDKNDPTIINVAAQYVPVFGVNWIMVTHTLRSSL